MRFTDTSLGVGDTGPASVRLVTLDTFLCLGSKLESEYEWRNVSGATYDIHFFFNTNLNNQLIIRFFLNYWTKLKKKL